MVTDQLWRQVQALPLAERLELVDRIEATVPAAPATVLPTFTRDELRDLIERNWRDHLDHPGGGVAYREAIASIRANLVQP